MDSLSFSTSERQGKSYSDILCVLFCFSTLISVPVTISINMYWPAQSESSTSSILGFLKVYSLAVFGLTWVAFFCELGLARVRLGRDREHSLREIEGIEEGYFVKAYYHLSVGAFAWLLRKLGASSL